MKLNTKVLKEEVVFGSDKNIYAVISETKEKRNINEHGCDLLKIKKEQIIRNDKELETLKSRITEIEADSRKLQIEVGKLYDCGFCNQDEKHYVRDSITGQIASEYLSHRSFCKNFKR